MSKESYNIKAVTLKEKDGKLEIEDAIKITNDRQKGKVEVKKVDPEIANKDLSNAMGKDEKEEKFAGEDDIVK